MVRESYAALHFTPKDFTCEQRVLSHIHCSSPATSFTSGGRTGLYLSYMRLVWSSLMPRLFAAVECIQGAARPYREHEKTRGRHRRAHPSESRRVMPCEFCCLLDQVKIPPSHGVHLQQLSILTTILAHTHNIPQQTVRLPSRTTQRHQDSEALQNNNVGRDCTVVVFVVAR